MSKKKRRYFNARFILPDDLYQQVRQHLEGKLVWFPKEREISLDDRNAYICQLRNEGLTAEEIARRVNLKPRQIWRIVKANHATSQPSLGDVEEKHK